MPLPFLCAYCGTPSIRHYCRAHRDLPKLDATYVPRGALSQPATEHRRRRKRSR